MIFQFVLVVYAATVNRLKYKMTGSPSYIEDGQIILLQAMDG